ncbi:MAG: putative porin [Pyrinomonadaceae bacterium]|nr:putative porin [Pyrinomonadaceae bacterium]
MRRLFMRALPVCILALGVLCSAHAQEATAPSSAAASDTLTGDAAALTEVRRQLERQRAEIEELRAALAEQSRLLHELLSRTASSEATTTAPPAPTFQQATYTTGVGGTVDVAATRDNATTPQTETKNAQGDSLETRVGRVEAQTKTVEALSKQLGSITFSGDIRLRYESQFGQLNSLANDANPLVAGNEMTARNRARLRARLALRGQFGKEFDWGLRLATGTLPDVTSSNQTLTDFFAHKQFALDQAFITYRPAAVPGLRLQAGKFETPWLFTEMTWDVDLQPEGLNETYSRNFKNPALKNLTLVAWQLPLLERQAALMLDAGGRVSRDLSRRTGRDLALYGAQARARFALSSTAALTVSAADLYFSGTQFITPGQFFGGQLQIPVIITIPATATAPAQTVTALVPIPREQLVSGSSLGLSTANNNAVNRDGRLSSGFNLVDLIARFDITRSNRFPVTVLFNLVTNMQTRAVVLAGGPGGANRVLQNDENNGFWAEVQVGKTREQGDVQFGYTFMRIEKDAVLTPFNYSDIAQQTDIRAQRFNFSFTANPRVILSATGIFTQRPNGLLGVFGNTPPGSLNRPTTRLQFDTLFRF